MKKIFLIITIIFISSNWLSAQIPTVVVSEYKDVQAFPTGEWTELLVIQDNLNMVGYKMRDNNTACNDWQGGVEFKDIPLWRNVRAGTVIVINHRGGGAYDVNPADGYIEIDADNASYFIPRVWCSGCTVAGNWGQVLSIAESSDIIQILDKNDQHVHCLGHMPTVQQDYQVIVSNSLPNACYKGTLNNGANNQVVPGKDIYGYLCGYDALHQNTMANSTQTKGLPNNSFASKNENQLFWRELRQPLWGSPQLKTTVKPDRVELQWNSAADQYSADGTQGYLIVRMNTTDTMAFVQPVDGKIYNAGDLIAPATVVAVITNSQIITYTDMIKVACMTGYQYRVYAYRFGKDDDNKDDIPENGRGRAYNETNYAVANAINPGPAKPTLQMDKAQPMICEGDSIKLKAIAIGGPFSFQWYWYDQPINGETTPNLTVKKTGIYYVKISTTECPAFASDSLNIMVVNIPKATIGLKYNTFLKDTIIKICQGDTLSFRSSNGDYGEYPKWMRDGKEIQNQNDIEYKATIPGIYQTLISNKNFCNDTSVKIQVKYYDIRLKNSKDPLSYYLDQNKTFADDSFDLENIGSEPVSFSVTDIILGPEYTIISPVLPINLIPGTKIQIVIRYTPTKPGNYTEKIQFVNQCKNRHTVTIDAFKAISTLTASATELDYQFNPTCAIPKDSVILLTNSGTDPIIIDPPTVNSSDFIVTYPTSQINLNPKRRDSVRVKLVNKAINNYSGVLTIPFISAGKSDKVDINLKGSVVDPQAQFEPSVVDFKTMIDVDDSAETIVKVHNTCKVAIIFDKQPSDPSIRILNLPVSLAPDASTDLLLSIKPSLKGFINFNDSTIAVTINGSCSFPVKFSVMVENRPQQFHFTSPTLDFGKLVQCDTNLNKTDSVRFIMQEKSKKTLFITDIKINGNFKTSLKDSTIAKDTTIINITFPPAQIGNYIGSLGFTIQPGNIKHTLSLNGRRVNPMYKSTKTSVNFGSLQVPISISDSILLKNTGEADIIIDSISGIKPPFSFKNGTTVPKNYYLKQGDSVVLYFDYVQTKVTYDSIMAAFEISSPCKDRVLFSLVGRGLSAPPSGNLKVYMPNYLVAKPGEKVRVTYNFIAYDNFSYLTTAVNGFSAQMTYNPTIFFPFKDSIHIGSAALAAGTTVLSINEIKPGLAEIKYTPIDGTKLKTGIWFEIIGMALFGNATQTYITLDSIKIGASRKLDVPPNISVLSVNTGCDLSDHSIDFGNIFNYQIASSLPLCSDTYLEFKSVVDDYTKIEIFNSLGQSVSTLVEGSVAPGLHKYLIKVSEMNDGVYFLNIRHSNIVQNQQFVILK
ncbi:MAG: hypothetical protein NT007_16955 [Candidatus Kapabacteria bacterium]|nr:hypothetical protein [Candidatus Kapabacteria bacterium]